MSGKKTRIDQGGHAADVAGAHWFFSQPKKKRRLWFPCWWVRWGRRKNWSPGAGKNWFGWKQFGSESGHFAFCQRCRRSKLGIIVVGSFVEDIKQASTQTKIYSSALTLAPQASAASVSKVYLYFLRLGVYQFLSNEKNKQTNKQTILPLSLSTLCCFVTYSFKHLNYILLFSCSSIVPSCLPAFFAQAVLCG